MHLLTHAVLLGLVAAHLNLTQQPELVQFLEEKHELFHLVNESLIIFASTYEHKFKSIESRFETLLYNQNELGSGITQFNSIIGALSSRIAALEQQVAALQGSP
jgi:uncharacterized protein YceH (UPF0502 family)